MDMGAFGRYIKAGTGYTAGLGDDYLIDPSFFHGVYFRGQFNNSDVPTPINQINPAIVIKKQGGVMVNFIQGYPCPTALLRVNSLVNMGFSSCIREGNQVIAAISISQAAGP